jgi:TolB-like protein
MFNDIGVRKQVEVDTSLERSIAVKPFYNLSGDPDQEYMCDGLTDEIINHLFKIASFDKVVSLSTVLTYKGTDKQLPQIAEELRVNYILEGTYKKIGDKVRVTAQLIEPKNDKHIWLNVYDQPYEEIITIQSDIALQIADHLKAFLTDSEKQNIQKIPTNNPEAYDFLQKALYSVRLSTSFSAGNTQLWDTILKVIELDPNYADAYAWAGWLIIASANYGGEVEIQSAAWDAYHYLEKAQEIDPDNGLAHYGLGLLNDWFTWDYIKAEREFLKAIELVPNFPGIHSQYGELLIKVNRLKDAKTCFEKREWPFHDRYREIRREIFINDKTEAYNSINELLDLYQEQVFRWVGEAYVWLEEYDSARFYLESAVQNEDAEMQVPRFQACLALAYHKTENDQWARTIINQLITKSDETTAGSPDFFTGWYYSGIGKVDSAFYWLEKAYKNKSPEIPWLKVDPVFNNLKDDDRYWDLYERTGHKAYDEYMANKDQ